MDSLANRIATLPAEKRALLELKLKEKGVAAVSAELIIPRRVDGGTAPLSFAQQRLWFLDQMVPGTPLYNLPDCVRLRGPLDIKSLEQSLNEIIRRHQALRTTFTTVEGFPVQVIKPELLITPAVLNLSDRPETGRENEALCLLGEEARRPFDLEKGPLLRVMVVRLDQDDHFLLLTMNHIVADGWSTGVLFQELSTLYDSISHCKPSPLFELPFQYADYALWQRECLQGEVLEKQLGYWKKQLQNISTLQLPIDHPRPPVQTFCGARQSCALSRELTDGLNALSRKQGVTLFMTMLAAFQVLLHRYTGQNDIVVGSPIAGRNRSDLEALIGFFVNTLVLRVDLSGNPSFRELLSQVRETTLEAYAHQDLPFEKLVEELQPVRDLSYSPIFQVMFVLQNEPTAPLRLEGVTSHPVRLDSEVAQFDLTLFAHEEPEGLRVSWQYNKDLFDNATICRMSAHFQSLLEGIIAIPDQPILDLPLLSRVERQQIIVDWNDTKRDFPQDKCIHELFENQVEKTPDTVALTFKNQQLTYRELNAKANQLAHYLRKLGVGPQVFVGLCMERSLEMVVGILAVLKAGGAYVPIDPDYPQDRLSYMLESANAPVLITQNSLIQSSHLPNTKSVCLGTDWGEIARNSDKNLVPLSGPNDLFYVIYTSGSTGRPKGASVYQRGFLNLVHWFNREFSITANDRLLLVSSPSFDLTQKNIFAALIGGGELHLLPGVQHDPEQIAQIIAKQRITLLNCTPSAFYPLVERGGVATYEMLRSLRVVVLGGEPISIERLRPWMESEACNCEIVNTYGPTECTDICASYRMNRQTLDAYSFVPIGRPIFNVQLVVLDEKLRLCPPGVVGELCVAGGGVGAGYIDDPELTAAKFIPNPFAELSGDKIYKTGDRVRTLPDGNIEYLERIDHQVKLRGFRIELGEIEAVLVQHPTVREAVVVAREDMPGEKRLVAYVVSTQNPVSTTSELRDFLQQKLPDYMIPSAFMTVDVLPLTANGKVDRRALPAPDETRLKLEKYFVAPRDDLELQLSKIWEKVLEVKPIGVRDNFFELGGHSLLAIRMIAQIEKKLTKHLPLAALFQAPTIEELASFLRQKGRSESWSSLLAIQPKGPKLPFFCVQGNADLAHHLGPDQPFYALQPSPLEGKKFSSSKVEDIAVDFVKEMRALQPEGPYLLGGFSFGGKVAFEMAHQLCKQGHEVRLLALLDPGSIHIGKLSSPVSTISSTLSEKMTLLCAEFRRRLRKLAVLAPQQKLTFLWTGVKWRVEGRVAKILREIKKIACWFYLAMGRRLPPGLRSLYFVEVSRRAARRYVPQVYPGRVIVFPTEDMSKDERSEWERLAGGGFEFHAVPGNHSTVLKEPNVRLWAETLKTCLDQAQAAE